MLAGQAFSQELYRYVDKDGVTILSNSIPAAYVNTGYEVLDSQGQLIQVVLPQVEDATAEPKLVVEKSDTILMTSYSNVVEIEERRDRKIDSIEREIDNIRSDRRVLGMQLDKEIVERDRILAIGEQNKLSPNLLGQLEAVEARILSMTDTAAQLDAQLITRTEDIGSIKSEYAVKVERFIQLEQSDVDVRHTSLQNPD